MSCIQVCDCNFTMSNTGTDCQPLMEVVKKLLFMPVYDSTGVRNFIDLSVAIDATTFSDMINQTDPSKRLYPIPQLKDIKDTRGEPVYQTFPDDSRIYIRDGIRSFDGMIVGRDGNPTLKGKIESIRCGEMGVYMVDRLGNLIGTISDDGTQLFPVRIDAESLSANFTKATDTTIQGLQVLFNFHPDESDTCLRMVTSSEMDDVQLLMLKGLLDVFGIFTSPSATGVTLKLVTQYGTPINPTTVKGLVSADFVSSVGGATAKVRNTTDSLDVTVTATESATNPGTYTLAWASQTAADVIIVFCKKDGFDFTALKSQPVTIP